MLRERMRWTREAALVAVICSCAPAPAPEQLDCPDPVPWQAMLASHHARYPDMAIPDALKLLQQATMGSEHAAPDSTSAAAWMDREWNTLESGPQELIADTLGQAGRFARVHLRPYRDAGGDPARLTAAFVATGHDVAADSTALRCAIDAVTATVPWNATEWRAAAGQWAQDGYPAMHHSPGYESAYRPAYRVVSVDRVSGLLLGP